MAVAALSEISLTPIFDNNGALVRNARLYFYRPGTLDPVTVYQDQELGAPHPQPIVTGGSGRVPPVYVGPDPYRIRIFDNANQLVEDIPWLPGATEATGGGGGPGGDTAIKTGDVIWAFSNGGVRDGWVRLNGGTIGSALSGATERANADAHDLFVYLWGQDTDGIMPVTPSRGASAESDWLANKQLQLVDMAGSVLGGITTMGRPARNVLAGVPFSRGDATKVGARMGEATHVLAVAAIPAHKHTLTDPGHNHVSTQGAHTHAVSDPGHNHSLNDPGHAHGIYDPGHGHTVNDPAHAHGVYDPGHDHSYTDVRPVSGSNISTGPGWSNTTDGKRTGDAKTGISIYGAYTGISINGSGTGIGVHLATTGMSLNGSGTGISIQATAPAITVLNSTTGITMSDTGGGGAHNTTQLTVLGTFYMRL